MLPPFGLHHNVQALPLCATHPFTTPPWMQAKLGTPCARGSHKSATKYLLELRACPLAQEQQLGGQVG